jgi:2-polyprenyl-6-methoxyphenol hydroxylase-like FAD-dependent oxidoreductase
MGLLDAAALAEALATTFNHEIEASCSDANANKSAFVSALKLQQASESYAKKRRAHVRFYQVACYLLTPFYQSDNRVLPFFRDLIFEPVTRIPFVRKIITALGSGMMLWPLKKIKLIPSEPR